MSDYSYLKCSTNGELFEAERNLKKALRNSDVTFLRDYYEDHLSAIRAEIAWRRTQYDTLEACNVHAV